MTLHLCQTPGCGNEWNDVDGRFPLCITAGCNLKEIRDGSSRRASKKEQFSMEMDEGAMVAMTCRSAAIGTSLTSIRQTSSSPFCPYNMDGSQSAKTTVKLRDGTTRDFVTSDRMHSEMCAVDFMLSSGEWTLFLGKVYWAHDFSTVTVEQFATAEPHCGFCTVFLLAAGLPVGRPTFGNHMQASQLNYQLPEMLMTSHHYLANILSHGTADTYAVVKGMLNSFTTMDDAEWVLEYGGGCYADENSSFVIPNGRTIVKLSAVVGSQNGQLFWLIWKHVFAQIMNTNKAGAKDL